MVKSISVNSRRPTDARVFALLTSILLIAALAPAFGQSDFTLNASTPSPFAVEPGGTSTSTLTVNAATPAASVDVALSCQVTPVQATATPACAISPQSATTPATPSLTITTLSTAPATLYTITVTGVDQNSPSNTAQATVNLSVLAVTADYTLTVTTPVTPSSVHAGSGATAVITVSPLNGYNGAVTLSCSAVTPAVAFGPTCSFPSPPVSITSNAPQTSTLTINTIGTAKTTTAAISHSGFWSILFMPLPGMLLLALGRGRKKLLAFLTPYVLALGMLLLPACNTNSTSTSTSTTGATPNNSYTFTITGTDSNSLAPSNGTQSVTLAVN